MFIMDLVVSPKQTCATLIVEENSRSALQMIDTALLNVNTSGKQKLLLLMPFLQKDRIGIQKGRANTKFICIVLSLNPH